MGARHLTTCPRRSPWLLVPQLQQSPRQRCPSGSVFGSPWWRSSPSLLSVPRSRQIASTRTTARKTLPDMAVPSTTLAVCKTLADVAFTTPPSLSQPKCVVRAAAVNRLNQAAAQRLNRPNRAAAQHSNRLNPAAAQRSNRLNHLAKHQVNHLAKHRVSHRMEHPVNHPRVQPLRHSKPHVVT